MKLLEIVALLSLLAVPTLAGGNKKTFTFYEIDTREGTNPLPSTPSYAFAYNYELRESVNGKNIGSSIGFCGALPKVKTTIVDSRNAYHCVGTLHLPAGTISYSGGVSSAALVDAVVTVTGGSGKYAGITGTAVQTRQSADEFAIYKYKFTVQY